MQGRLRVPRDPTTVTRVLLERKGILFLFLDGLLFFLFGGGVAGLYM